MNHNKKGVWTIALRGGLGFGLGLELELGLGGNFPRGQLSKNQQSKWTPELNLKLNVQTIQEMRQWNMMRTQSVLIYGVTREKGRGFLGLSVEISKFMKQFFDVDLPSLLNTVQWQQIK